MLFKPKNTDLIRHVLKDLEGFWWTVPDNFDGGDSDSNKFDAIRSFNSKTHTKLRLFFNILKFELDEWYIFVIRLIH